MVTIRADFTMAFVSAGVEERLGRPRAAYLGVSVADFLHPDDLEDIELQLATHHTLAQDVMGAWCTPAEVAVGWPAPDDAASVVRLLTGRSGSLPLANVLA